MNQIIQNGSRNKAADFVKGILIFCVLYSHSIQKIDSLRDASWTTSFVNVFVTSFEMPLFILVSGYFLYLSLSRRSYKDVLIKRFVSIAIPIFVWEALPYIFKLVINFKDNGFSVISVLKIAYKCIFPGKLWFLGAYLFCTVFLIGVEWFCGLIKNKNGRTAVKLIIYGVLIIVLQFIKYPFMHIPYLFPFFLMGFLLSKYDVLNNLNAKKAIYLLSALFIVLYLFYKAEYSLYLLTYLDIGKILLQLPIIVYRLVLGVCGCSAVYLVSCVICTKFPNSKFVSYISRLGSKTMELYILSVFIQDALCSLIAMFWRDTALINDITSPLLFAPIFMVILVAICLLVDFATGKIKVLHKILFGR